MLGFHLGRDAHCRIVEGVGARHHFFNPQPPHLGRVLGLVGAREVEARSISSHDEQISSACCCHRSQNEPSPSIYSRKGWALMATYYTVTDNLFVCGN